MNADPLQAYRRNRPAPVVEDPDMDDEAAYTAFAAKDRAQYMEIRLSDGVTSAPQNVCLVNIVFDRPHFSYFIIHYTFMDVIVKGRNLQEIVFAIQNKMAGYIQAFNAERWAKPTDEKTSFIESIEIQMHVDPQTISTAQ